MVRKKYRYGRREDARKERSMTDGLKVKHTYKGERNEGDKHTRGIGRGRKKRLTPSKLAGYLIN
jgi:hypothetical protein